jgi:hypothetical protein
MADGKRQMAKSYGRNCAILRDSSAKGAKTQRVAKSLRAKARGGGEGETETDFE